MLKKALLISAVVLLLGAGCANRSQMTEDKTGEPPVSPGASKSGELTVPTPPIPADNSEARTWAFPGILSDKEIGNRQVRIKTAKGEIVFELFEGEAPKAVSNFVYLANGEFYKGLTFHRREEGFVIQGGDPSGNGSGDPGYRFEDEPVSRAYDQGIVAMANRGPDTNGSQFFIMLEDYSLPPKYTIFGRVTKGMDVVGQIAVGDVMEEVIIERK